MVAFCKASICTPPGIGPRLQLAKFMMPPCEAIAPNADDASPSTARYRLLRVKTPPYMDENTVPPVEQATLTPGIATVPAPVMVTSALGRLPSNITPEPTSWVIPDSKIMLNCPSQNC